MNGLAAARDTLYLKSVQAHASGRILLSQPSLTQIPHISEMLAAAWEHQGSEAGTAELEAVPASGIAPPPNTGSKPVWLDLCFLPPHPAVHGQDTVPFGVMIDTRGSIHSADTASDLETLLSTAPLDDTQLLTRARHAAEWMRTQKLCKDPALCMQNDLPNAPFVLILDQARTDPLLTHTSDPEAQLREMLVLAHEAHPHATLVIYSPECDSSGPLNGHFDGADASPNVQIHAHLANPWELLEQATAVYTLNSHLGFEAILAGHRPHVFGTPWYAGWGLTEDHTPIYKRGRKLTRAQLVAGALFQYTHWYDPDHKRLTTLETILARASAQQRAALEDARGYVASNILRWKRLHLSRYFGASGMRFAASSDEASHCAAAQGQTHLAWGANPDADVRIEDGFLRSRGLGAALVPPLSLICDDTGIYFDPTRASQMERHITRRTELPDHARARAARLHTQLIAARLSKYNVGNTRPDLPEGHKILVAGQVEDDASILLGAGDICTNRALLVEAKARNPDAVIIFKPHPDVEAGLRRGKVVDAAELADVIATDADPVALMEACDEVWTMTSLIGFEALLRDKPVTCTGAPFYAGWGLTTDLGAIPARRGRQNGQSVSLLGLIHAALIDAPRYFDPKTGAAISPERAIELLQGASSGRSKMALAVLATVRQFRARFLGLDR